MAIKCDFANISFLSVSASFLLPNMMYISMSIKSLPVMADQKLVAHGITSRRKSKMWFFQKHFYFAKLCLKQKKMFKQEIFEKK